MTSTDPLPVPVAALMSSAVCIPSGETRSCDDVWVPSECNGTSVNAFVPSST